MRQRSFILLAAFIALLLAGAVGVYAYDSSRDDVIAKGVTAGGIDVGGMKAGEARQTLRDRLQTPLERPLVVKRGHEHFRLTARRARLRTDVEGMVQEAVGRSRQGNLLTRTVRGLTGGRVSARIAPKISYSAPAVRSLVRRVKQSVDRSAKDANVAFSSKGVDTVASQTGIAVRGRELAHRVRSALVSPAGARLIPAHTKITEPKITSDQLASRYPAIIVVNRPARQLRLYRRLRLAKAYPIAVGRQGLETPAGLYHIQDKQVNPSWHVPNSPWAGKLAGKVIPPGPQDPLKARWMGFNGGAGIHGTADVASLGTAASHGCIRMSIPDVENLFDQVQVATPVYVS